MGPNVCHGFRDGKAGIVHPESYALQGPSDVSVSVRPLGRNRLLGTLLITGQRHLRRVITLSPSAS
jgi:hypothetical protein